MVKKRHKGFTAFTLAEVLITLSIIGVVAAMTIPTLMNVFQKEVCYRGFQKEYSTLTQAFQQLITENGDFRGAIEEYGSGAKAFQAKIKTIKFCPPNTYGECFPMLYKSLDGAGEDSLNPRPEDYDSLVFADGSAISYADWTGDACNGSDGTLVNIICGDLTIDINGIKKPNQIGRDLFSFAVTQDKIVPVGSEGLFTYTSNWKWYCDPTVSDPNGGRACATRLLQEGRFTY